MITIILKDTNLPCPFCGFAAMLEVSDAERKGADIVKYNLYSYIGPEYHNWNDLPNEIGQVRVICANCGARARTYLYPFNDTDYFVQAKKKAINSWNSRIYTNIVDQIELLDMNLV